MANYGPEQLDRDADWYNKHEARIAELWPEQWVAVRDEKVVMVDPDVEWLGVRLRGVGLDFRSVFHQPTCGYDVFMERTMEQARAMPSIPEERLLETSRQRKLDSQFLDEHDEEFREKYKGRLVVIHKQHPMIFIDRQQFTNYLNVYADRFVIREGNVIDTLDIPSVGRYYFETPEEEAAVNERINNLIL